MTDDAFHLTALDARRYDFGNALRGYDRGRVDQFRDQVAGELERLSRANQELEVKARNFHEQLRAFRERDKALNDALISAQQLRGEIREQAQREAQLIIREAQGDAERALDALRSDIRRAEDDLQQLWRNRRSYVQQLRQLMERQLHDLDSAEMVPPPVGLTNLDATREQFREAPWQLGRESEQHADDSRLPARAEHAPPAALSREERSAALSQSPAEAQPVSVPSAARTSQQPWARSVSSEPVPPLMQPVPYPLPNQTRPMSTPSVASSPQPVVPPATRPSLPTPSWLDVVEGE